MSSLMALLLFLITIFVVGMMLTIPRRLLKIAGANCSDTEGRFSLRQASNEGRAIIGLGASFVLATAFVAIPLLVGLIGFDAHVMPVSMAQDVIGQLNTDPNVTRRNLDRKGLDHQHRNFFRRRGHSESTARDLQRGLFLAWPIAIPMLIGLTYFGFQFVGGIYISALRSYRRNLLTRWVMIHWGVPKLDTSYSLEVVESIALYTAREMRPQPPACST